LCEDHFGQKKGPKDKRYTSAALVRWKIIDIVSGASLSKTEVLGEEVNKPQKAGKCCVY